MKVYIVMYDNPYEWQDFEVTKVFKIERAAKKYVRLQQDEEDYYIVECDVE